LKNYLSNNLTSNSNVKTSIVIPDEIKTTNMRVSINIDLDLRCYIIYILTQELQ